MIGYLTARSTKNLVVAGNIETTRDWWQNRRNDLLLYISQVVLDEVAKGDTEIALKRLEIVNEMPLVELNQAVR
ncbi:MAG: DNA-binding protein, partial [Microcystis aeruginosa Ma_MB_F_20061100_S20]